MPSEHAVMESVLGKDDPHTAMPSLGVAASRAQQGATAEARRRVDAIEAVFKKKLEADDERWVFLHYVRGQIFFRESDFKRSVSELEAALALAARLKLRPVDQGDLRLQLAKALWRVHGQRARAEALAREVAQLYSDENDAQGLKRRELAEWKRG